MAILASSSLYAPCSHSPLCCSSSKPIPLFSNSLHFTLAHHHHHHHHHEKRSYSKSQIRFAKNSGKNDEEEEDPSVPSWAKPGSEDPPLWARGESKKDSFSFEVPFYVYLLASSVTAIAAIGSVFEYMSQNPVFGIVRSDSVFYTPLLGFFAVTGIPTSAYLWFKSVQIANKEQRSKTKGMGNQLSYHPKDNYMITSYVDGTIQVWKTRKGKVFKNDAQSRFWSSDRYFRQEPLLLNLKIELAFLCSFFFMCSFDGYVVVYFYKFGFV